MEANFSSTLKVLRSMNVKELKIEYRKVFGEEATSNNKEFLFKRVAWRIQANESGGLSEKARTRALELANDSDLRIKMPKKIQQAVKKMTEKTDKPKKVTVARTKMVAGSLISRVFKGKKHTVRALENGFEYEGEAFRTLSGIAKAITGTNWNGFTFFGISSTRKTK